MTTKGIPVRIQKAGDAPAVCRHAEPAASAVSGAPRAAGMPSPAASASEPKVEVRQVEEGVFEITVTCSCGERSVVRCESLIPPA